MNKNSMIEYKKILQKRADLLAQPQKKITLNSSDFILAFFVGNEKYAVKTNAVMKVIPFQEIAYFPFSAEIFSGIIYYSGILWPIMHCKKMFEQNTDSVSSHIILLMHEEQQLGLLVDQIIGQYPYDGSFELKKLMTEKAMNQTIIEGIYHDDIAVIHIAKLYEYIMDLNNGA